MEFISEDIGIPEEKNAWFCFVNEAGERWKDFLCKKKQ
jgi:hypothetical protein